jgi:hypothetical protein
MKLFQQRELKDAYLYAEQGGQALLLCKRQPRVPQSACLIDHNTDRLISTVRNLGRRWPFPVVRARLSGQHVILQSVHLDRALAECSALELPLA